MIAQTETCAGSEVTLRDIETAATAFAVAHNDLTDTVRQLEDALNHVRADYIKTIRKEVARAADRRSQLAALIQSAPHLFESPRTLTLAGIKVGFRKGTGGIDWEEDAKVVALIRKQFTKDEADLLIKTTEKPIAKALADLDVATLKKLGCTVESTGDVVVIKPASDVDKIVKALLKEATDEAAG